MSKPKKVLLAVLLPVGVIIGFLISQVVMLSEPTEGERIARYARPQKAVLVIDIQEDFTGTTAKPPFPYKDSERLIATVNRITEAASGRGLVVAYIRQELDGFTGRLLSTLFAGGTAIKGNPGTEIDRRVKVVSGDVFPKPKSDAFSNPDLDRFLTGRQVDELYLVGLDAAGCVHNTARGALNRGYAVSIVTDAIVLREEEKWDGLLKQYRDEGITLMSTQEFLDKLR